MEATRGRRTRAPLVYGGAVLLLLVAALFLRGFSLDIGDARLAGRWSLLPLFSARTLDRLTVTWNGLSLQFARVDGAGLAGFDGDTRGGAVLLAGGARVALTPGTDTGGSIALSLDTAAPAGAARTLTVGYALAGVPLDPPAGAALAWRSSGATYLLALPAAARVDAKARTITLPLTGAAWSATLSAAGTTAVASAPRPASSSPTATAAKPAAQGKPPDEKSMPSADTLQAALSRWADAAWNGWTVARWSAPDGRWRAADGTLAFSEDIGVALLAEAVARGSWKTAYAAWADALAQRADRGETSVLTGVTSAWVGGARAFARAEAAAAAAVISRARDLLASSDDAFLRLPGAVRTIALRGPGDLAAQAAAFLASRSPASLDAVSALGLAEAILAEIDLGAGSDAMRKVLQDAVNRRLLTSVRTTDAGVFLDAGSGAVSVAASIRAGALLLRAGAALGDSRASAVGRGLLVSALALADANGSPPATLRLSAGKIAGRDGALAPESFYTILPLGRRLPREVPLASPLVPGASLWTLADVSARTSGGTLTLVFSFPAGIPHHFALRGVRPFGQVQMHRIPWHADPSFAKYSDGWAWDADAGLFYGKLTGRADTEEIVITFPGA